MSVKSNHYAAIDLGSNSFHLIVVEYAHHQIKVLDKHVEVIRLAGGLDKKGRLSDSVRTKALECLERFSQRLKTVPKKNIRVVGTNTLRRASSSNGFIKQASKALGHDIEVISGFEEARLIYLGVSHSLEDEHDKRLVIDIGGGSTEFIVGRHFEQDSLNSLEMGCVTITNKFFPDGCISPKRLNKAIQHCRLKLLPHKEQINSSHWDVAIGSSGTIKSINSIVRELHNKLSPITFDDLKKIKQALLYFEHIDQINIHGLKKDRIPVILGGFAVLYAAFKSLKINKMFTSSYSLREGLIYEMIGRIEKEDVREKTVKGILSQYNQDKAHLKRVAKATIEFYDQVSGGWDMSSSSFDCRKLLYWSALLHEIGSAISHKRIQKHSAYLLENTDMPGFSQTEQQILALLVLSHKKKIPAELVDSFQMTKNTTILYRLIIILRISVLLFRDRNNHKLPAASAKDNQFMLFFDTDWINKHTLTQLDLEIEATTLAKYGFELITLDQMA